MTARSRPQSESDEPEKSSQTSRPVKYCIERAFHAQIFLCIRTTASLSPAAPTLTFPMQAHPNVLLEESIYSHDTHLPARRQQTQPRTRLDQTRCSAVQISDGGERRECRTEWQQVVDRWRSFCPGTVGGLRRGGGRFDEIARDESVEDGLGSPQVFKNRTFQPLAKGARVARSSLFRGKAATGVRCGRRGTFGQSGRLRRTTTFSKRCRSKSVPSGDAPSGSFEHSLSSSVKSHATRMAISRLRRSDKLSSAAASTMSAKSVAIRTASATKASTSEEAMAGSALLRCKPTCCIAAVKTVRAERVAFEGSAGVGTGSKPFA